MSLDAHRDEITLEDLTALMAGGDELETLAHELQRSGLASDELVEEIEAVEHPHGTQA